MSMERDFVEISINQLRGSSRDLHVSLCGGILAQHEYIDLVQFEQCRRYSQRGAE